MGGGRRGPWELPQCAPRATPRESSVGPPLSVCPLPQPLQGAASEWSPHSGFPDPPLGPLALTRDSPSARGIREEDPGSARWTLPPPSQNQLVPLGPAKGKKSPDATSGWGPQGPQGPQEKSDAILQNRRLQPRGREERGDPGEAANFLMTADQRVVTGV